jgi:hypothetical protein
VFDEPLVAVNTDDLNQFVTFGQQFGTFGNQFATFGKQFETF